MHLRGCKRLGFTLVELLVVIGIIALLIGILLPTLSRARAHANWIKCQANLMDIGRVMQLYVNDSNGWMYPPLRGANTPHDARWTNFVFDVWNPPIMICPSDLAPMEEHSYILNSHLWEKKVKWSTRDLGGKSSSDVVVLGEKKSEAADYYVDAGENFDRLVELYRHGLEKGSNYLYMDWHVETQRDKSLIRHNLDPWDLPVESKK